MVRIAGSTAEWSEAIADLLGPENNTWEQVERRRSFAQGYDWNVLVGRIAQAMCETLARPMESAALITTIASVS
jgi:hypothetical protein